eukprot:CAMPEP_0167747856 /NCGR_PEP_ID=MMETSP0110_2-20121227/4516_1 /TAXON_ID=629695 /ORGANISM="Gymnochlora sp., Strain CCMP2014" /LENGTH=155 /DNA_ID=CAMNT_0007632809 /DNA_START=130 /DNA_END=597 /DNA_ORIENTATION=+
MSIAIIPLKKAFGPVRRRATPLFGVKRAFMEYCGKKVVYSGPPGTPVVTMFTKPGCSLCLIAESRMRELLPKYPHTFEAVDISVEGNEEWNDRYCNDIPVLHLNGKYWLKHNVNRLEGAMGLLKAEYGIFRSMAGEPNAKAQQNTSGYDSTKTRR